MSLTHSGTAAHLKRTEGTISIIPEQPACAPGKTMRAFGDRF
jgi:hypothetical protein